MKKNSAVLLLMMLFVAAFTIDSYAGDEKEVKYQTNLHCGSCKAKIESGLKKEKGVKSASADVETKVVTVKYDDSATDNKKIQNFIAEMGYKADEVKTRTDINSKKPCCSSKIKQAGCGK
ncbi:MAG: heavy-metal-associated domain-containing protein [Candidatus Kapaibacterium sp.]